jgi:hypothetical protein
MDGVIGLSQSGKVYCNVINCYHEAKFSWFFQNTEKQPLVAIKGDNIIDFFGDGRYICRVNCGEVEGIFEANLAMSFSGKEYAPQNVQEIPINVVNNEDWDFSKLPKDKKTKAEIVAHVTEKRWKDLAKIHNHYQLSNKTICCNMAEVEKEFTAYVNMSAPKSKVVRGTK